MSTDINFSFVRHGYACHNAVKGLIKTDTLSLFKAQSFIKTDEMIDPPLTQVGVDASIHNGCVVSNIIKSIPELQNTNLNLNLKNINVIGCSPLIRCMETAYFMSRNWINPPNKIYIFPHLREIDESSTNKFSKESKINIDNKPYYAMKDIQDQKKYLEKIGILQFFDFTFVENFSKERMEPGDINNFILWFITYFIGSRVSLTENINVFIVTHAGVLHDFLKNASFTNNSGFLLTTSIYHQTKNIKINDYYSFIPYLNMFHFYNDYETINTKEYFCPSDRCGNLCDIAKGPPNNNEIKHIETTTKCEIESDTE